MQLEIPEYVVEIYKTIERSGHKAYFVGGCVRNLFLAKKVKDWDLTTDATPDQIQKLFSDSFYDNSFGTVGVPVENPESEKPHVIEITTFRTERNYTDNRHPEIVEWGKSIEEDLERRDFTVNAIAIRVTSFSDNKPTEFSVIDPYHGQEDLEKKLIKAVGNPQMRFKEDGLRLMRAIRFATQLGFDIEEATLKEIQNDAPLLDNIANERIHDELLKILGSEFPYEGIMLLKNTNLLGHILPELLEGIGVSQERPGRHHKDDVFTHNLLALKYTPATDPVVRFAALIHDIAKPRVAGEDKDGYVIFHNHEIEGAKMAEEICNRLKFSKKDRDKIVTLVRWHMFSVDEHTTDAAIRRFIRRVGIENVKDMIDLRIGDRLGSGTQSAESWRLKLFKKRLEEQLAPAPFSINDLAIDGNDVMRTLNLMPSRRIGEILQKLFEEVDEDLSKNTKEYLLQRIKELA